MIRKNTPAAASPPPYQRRAETSRQLTSAQLDVHLAAFEAAGGKVEVLATTAVLKRIQADPKRDAPSDTAP